MNLSTLGDKSIPAQLQHGDMFQQPRRRQILESNSAEHLHDLPVKPKSQSVRQPCVFPFHVSLQVLPPFQGRNPGTIDHLRRRGFVSNGAPTVSVQTWANDLML